MRNWIFAAVGVVGMVAATSASAGTLEDVRARGHLNCIVNTGLTGFASPDDAGNWTGFDVEFCRAVAAAVLGDASKVEFVTATGKTRFTKLAAGEGVVLLRLALRAREARRDAHVREALHLVHRAQDGIRRRRGRVVDAALRAELVEVHRVSRAALRAKAAAA